MQYCFNNNLQNLVLIVLKKNSLYRHNKFLKRKTVVLAKNNLVQPFIR